MKGALRVRTLNISLFSVVTGTVDPYSNTILAGGVCISGPDFTFTRTNIAQSVVTETLQFIPYDSETLTGDPGRQSHVEVQLKAYLETCSSIALKSLLKVQEYLGMSGNLPEVRSLIATVMEVTKFDPDTESTEAGQTFSGVSGHTGLLKYLEKMEALPFGDSFESNLSNLYEAFEADVRKDPLMMHKYDPSILKPCFDTVHENTVSSTLRTLIIGQNGAKGIENIRQCADCHPDLQLDLSIASDQPSDSSEGTLKWKIGDGLLDSMNPYHLVVVESISDQNSLKWALQQVLDLLSEKGFILLNDVTDKLEIMVALHSLRFNSGVIEDKESRDIGRWLTRPSWEKIFKDLELELVSVKFDQLQSTWFLLRKSKEKGVASNQLTVNVADLKCDWLIELKETMVACQKRPKGENLWIYSKNQPCNGIVGLVKCLRKEPGGSRVR